VPRNRLAANNAFNKLEQSDQKILKLEALQKNLPDSLMLKIWQIKEDNCIKLYNYAGAQNAVQTALDRYSNILTGAEKDDLRNNLKIWASLAGQPRKRVTIKGDTRLKMTRDKAGLKNLSVNTGFN
jgi:hypothetical protein